MIEEAPKGTECEGCGFEEEPLYYSSRYCLYLCDMCFEEMADAYYAEQRYYEREEEDE